MSSKYASRTPSDGAPRGRAHLALPSLVGRRKLAQAHLKLILGRVARAEPQTRATLTSVSSMTLSLMDEIVEVSPGYGRPQFGLVGFNH